MRGSTDMTSVEKNHHKLMNFTVLCLVHNKSISCLAQVTVFHKISTLLCMFRILVNLPTRFCTQIRTQLFTHIYINQMPYHWAVITQIMYKHLGNTQKPLYTCSCPCDHDLLYMLESFHPQWINIATEAPNYTYRRAQSQNSTGHASATECTWPDLT